LKISIFICDQALQLLHNKLHYFFAHEIILLSILRVLCAIFYKNEIEKSKRSDSFTFFNCNRICFICRNIYKSCFLIHSHHSHFVLGKNSKNFFPYFVHIHSEVLKSISSIILKNIAKIVFKRVSYK